MKSEFALAFNEVLEEKQLPRDIIMSAVESAMVSAYRKSVNASTAQEVQVKIDLEKGIVKVFAEKEVSETVADDRTEVLLEVARQYNPEAQIGDLVMVESTPENFGRIAAQTARQGIQQKIRDAEKAAQFEFFGRQVGEIISGIVQAVNSRQATIGLDMKAEGTMLRKDMIPGERFRQHERIRAYVYEVKDTPKGLQILLSHTHRNFLRRLLENEVPEIYHGIVEIRSIAREPGQRAKVAVSATQQGIDPVGACVGQRGVRIQAIVRELHDEKIDVIEWNNDPAVYISKAISPARVSGVYLNYSSVENKTATVVVPEDQLSLAIGREGQNARLAAKLTGWRIDIMSLTEAAAKTVVKLREDPTLADLAIQEADTIGRVLDILQKKEEGRALSLDDNALMTRFVDRIEKRGEADRRQEDEEKQARLRSIKESIDPRAFEMPIMDIRLKEHTLFILQEAGLETFGDLIITVKSDPDTILSYNGIGPKTHEEILEYIESYQFPELEAVEEVAEEAESVEVPVEVVTETVEPQIEEVKPEVEVEQVAEIEEAELEPAAEVEEIIDAEPEEETEGEEKSFEELFNMESIRKSKDDREPSLEDEEMNALKAGKKSKGKKKKGYTVEYDPDKDTQYVRYKHKNEDDWEEW